MSDKVSIYYMCEDCTELKLMDDDLYGWIDVVYDAYCTVLSKISDGRNVTFSIRAKMPNGSYRDVKGDKDVAELTNFFKKEGKGIPMHISGVIVGDAMVENFTINGLSGVMIGPSTTTATITVDRLPIQDFTTITTTATSIDSRPVQKNMASSTTTTPPSTIVFVYCSNVDFELLKLSLECGGEALS
ncbi:hypothetical protein NE237_020111 [Protea cynaroides]|uniref:Uncharacterized protein n=1 Tax=Protea cynaroides TaxID=273540 RepID=A0A9Q0H5D4_9MAGN|nr:hypothetical protein NE237_020111 [Protea cynaroides]